MRHIVPLSCLILSICLTDPAAGQFRTGEPGDTPLGKTETQTWRFGMVITASGGGVRNLTANTTLPKEWLGQKVEKIDQDITPGVKVTYRELGDAATDMVVHVSQLPDGAQIRAVVTYRITRSWQLPPTETESYAIPSVRQMPANVRLEYLTPSPHIECTHLKIKAAAAGIGSTRDPAWEQVEAIYDFVKENVEHQRVTMTEVRGALAALTEGTGDCDEVTCLFIALCRARGIPARTVRLPTHCYPEFYLIDAKGQGHWFPCEPSSDRRIFGGIPELRPILQKGDKIRAKNQRNRTEIFRFAPQNLLCFPSPGGGAPRLELIAEKVEVAGE